MACKQNLDLRCVLISDPSTLGAGAKTRLESRIKNFTPHCIYRPVCLHPWRPGRHAPRPVARHPHIRTPPPWWRHPHIRTSLPWWRHPHIRTSLPWWRHTHIRTSPPWWRHTHIRTSLPWWRHIHIRTSLPCPFKLAPKSGIWDVVCSQMGVAQNNRPWIQFNNGPNQNNRNRFQIQGLWFNSGDLITVIITSVSFINALDLDRINNLQTWFNNLRFIYKRCSGPSSWTRPKDASFVLVKYIDLVSLAHYQVYRPSLLDLNHAPYVQAHHSGHGAQGCAVPGRQGRAPARQPAHPALPGREPRTTLLPQRTNPAVHFFIFFPRLFYGVICVLVHRCALPCTVVWFFLVRAL